MSLIESRTTLEAGGYRLVRIEPRDVDGVLHLVEPLLEQAIPHTEGFASVPELVEHMRAGVRAWQLWVVFDREISAVGAFLTTLERVGDSSLVCQFEVLAGVEAQAWIAPLIGRFEQYLAFMYGVTHTRIVGRPGWERFLRRHGYQPAHFVTSKRILPAVAEIEAFRPQTAVG